MTHNRLAQRSAVMLGALGALLWIRPIAAQGAIAGDGSVSLYVSYFGETGTHPGVAIGLEYAAFENSWYRLALWAEIGGYYHRRNHTAIFFDTGISNRFSANFGLYGELGAGIGYLHTWVDGEVYARKDDGGVAPTRQSGMPHLKVTGDLRTGFDFGRISDFSGGAFMGLSLFGEYPFNGYMLPHAAIQTGLSWEF